MRIIAGKFRGRRIDGPSGTGVRPATDRVRESVFNILQNRLDLSGIRVLDLFAGTGSLGFEALSRGAGEVTFVDNGREATELIRRNAGALGCEEVSEVITRDAAGFLAGITGIFQLIFADPPYEYPALAEIPRRVREAGILDAEGYLIIEHRRGTPFEPAYPPEGVFTRRFGNTEVSFFREPPAEARGLAGGAATTGLPADDKEEHEV